MDTENILLGSGDLYLMEFDSEDGIPEDTTFEVDANNVGDIKGGAELSYKPTIYEVTNDRNEVRKRWVTKEEVSFKSGLMTWFMGNLAKLCPGVLTDDTTKHEKVLKIGGAKVLKSYALRFVHAKEDGLKLRMTMVATATSGFTLKLDPAKETVVDAQFAAMSQSDGTLVEIRDEYAAA